MAWLADQTNGWFETNSTSLFMPGLESVTASPAPSRGVSLCPCLRLRVQALPLPLMITTPSDAELAPLLYP